MSTFNIPFLMARCLFFTIVIECIVAYFIGVRLKKDFINILLVNCITNPIVVTVPLFLNLKYGILERRISLLALEILTVVLEGHIYQKVLKYRKINGYFLSGILNLASYCIGELINYFLY